MSVSDYKFPAMLAVAFVAGVCLLSAVGRELGLFAAAVFVGVLAVSATVGYRNGRVDERKAQDSDETIEIRKVEAIIEQNDELTARIADLRRELEQERQLTAAMTGRLTPSDIVDER